MTRSRKLPEQQTRVETATQSPADKPLVLIVDDEASQRSLLSSVLASNFRTLAAESVASALEQVALERPSVVIMDYLMPEESGIDGIRQMRELHADLPIVMLTGHADLEVARSAIQVGAVEYVLKPFEPQDLVAVIGRCAQVAQEVPKDSAARAAEIPYSLQRRIAANVDLWRGRLPTVPSENRMEAIFDSGRRVEAKVLRLGRSSVQVEVYEPSFWMEGGKDISQLRIWIGDEQAYDGAGRIGGVITTGPTSVCEVLLANDWANSSTAPNSLTPERAGDSARNFVARWGDKTRIDPAFKLAIAEIAVLLSEMREWLAGVELTWPDPAEEGKSRAALEQIFQQAAPALTQAFGVFEQESKKVPEELVGLYAEHVRNSLHPMILGAPFVHRSFTKPLHYPGDYGVMNYMLGDPFQGDSLFTKIFNAWVVRSGACATYRFRVEHLGRVLRETVADIVARKGRPCRVLSLGCGAAPEVQRFITSESISTQAEFTLLDFSSTTLDYTNARLDAAVASSGRSVKFKTHEFSVQQMLAHGTRLVNNPKMVRSGLLEREGYDLLYCAGLFDYLSERVCERVLRIFWDLGAPGARILASNFAPPNPMRAFMDYVLDWRLLHRDESEVRALAVDRSLCPDPVLVQSPGGVEIFVEMRKAG